MKIVCLGDSLTYGYGVPKEFRWTEKMKQIFGEDVLNEGVNGDTTSGMLSRSYNDVVLKKPDIAIIMGGTNDFFIRYSCKYVFENICQLVDECIQYNIQPIIGIQTLVLKEAACKIWSPHINYTKVNDSIKELRDMIMNYCLDKKIKYIDFFSAFDDINFEYLSQYYLDGIHLNVKGHYLMSKKAIEIIKGD